MAPCFTFKVLVLIPLFVVTVASAEKDISAHKVAYLYYFSKFITWPSSTFSEQGDINLCVGEISENMAFQLSTIEGKRIGHHQLKTVNILKNPKGGVSNDNISKPLLKRCHLLYINIKMLDWFQQYSSELPHYTLTVSDNMPEENNSLIHLHRRDNRLSFEIKAQLAKMKGIKISSKLLKLSKERKAP